MRDKISEDHARLSGDSGAALSTGLSAGMSPYATGGGGFTFERKVAVQYLSHLLTGDGAVELGEGRHVVSVAFQQAPEHPVDDLVIRAARSDEAEPSLELSLEVRRSPKLIESDESTQRLFQKFVRVILESREDGPERRLGLVVSGPQRHAQQLSELAALASGQMDAPGFFNLLQTPGKFDAAIRGRLEHIEKLVERAAPELGLDVQDNADVQNITWKLLSNLVVLMPRLESADETDWSTVANGLTSVARSLDIAGALQLRDKLVVLAGEYASMAARVNLTLLRRNTHTLLNDGLRRNQQGWSVLERLHQRALSSVRHGLTTVDGNRKVRLPRDEARETIVNLVKDSAATIVSGDSGVGKSALTLASIVAASGEQPESIQALCVNLRHLPSLTVDLEHHLDCPLSSLLEELSAPHRLLVIDGADAATEGLEAAFRYLLESAIVADVVVVAIASQQNGEVVSELLKVLFAGNVASYQVDLLTPAELNQIVGTFPELNGLTTNPRSRELMRRLVVLDLLIRVGVTGLPMSDADAMEEIWAGLVRRHEQSDRGHPDARESVLLKLARLDVYGGDRLEAVSQLNPEAATGLRRDGLLQSSPNDPFEIGPDFAHDEIRRYAVARLLLAGMGPAARLMEAGAPRWALGAAKLACEAILQLPDSNSTPLKGRLAGLQGAFDDLVSAGHGARWGDIPIEALTSIADPTDILTDFWPHLLAQDDLGLQRLARIIDQRHRNDYGIIDTNVTEPIVAHLLKVDRPWKARDYATNLLREWLVGHAVARTPAGHQLRIRLRSLLVDACAEGDLRLRQERNSQELARTQENIERDGSQEHSPSARMSGFGYDVSSYRERPEIPREYRDEVILEFVALLGPDLGEDGEAILQRVANDAPWYLAPALEEPLTGLGLAQYRHGLLANLVEAYYLHEIDGVTDGDLVDTFFDGIRGHRSRRSGLGPLAAWYRGPFMSLFQSDFRGGTATLNRLLNHAARIRARKLARLDQSHNTSQRAGNGQLQTELSISGVPRQYVGDQHVWNWYRGTGVGPYPCMSALQALERTCDQFIAAGIPIKYLVTLLLDGCENFAMVGLVVQMLVRHLETADTLIDAYLSEPVVWGLEFDRFTSERGLIEANSDGLKNAERRQWTLREAGISLAMAAGDERRDELRALGNRLVEKSLARVESGEHAYAPEGAVGERDQIEQQMATVRGWASCLDTNNLQVTETKEGLLIQAKVPEESAKVLQPGNETTMLGIDSMLLTHKYTDEYGQIPGGALVSDELLVDLAKVRELLEKAPLIGPNLAWDTAGAVAAATLAAKVLHNIDVPIDDAVFAAEVSLRIAEGASPAPPYESPDTYFERGASRSAATALPLLLTPGATDVRTAIAASHDTEDLGRIVDAGLMLARSVSNETRMHLARSLDHVWSTPCVEKGSCHHEVAWRFIAHTFRDCTLGPWDPSIQGHQIAPLAEPLHESLAQTSGQLIVLPRLDAGIRALAPASTAAICVSPRARALLNAALAAHRHSQLHYADRFLDSRGTHSLVAARALLELSQHGSDSTVFDFIGDYAGSDDLLRNFLRGLSAAAEETPERAETARRIWPDIVRQTLTSVTQHRPGVLNDRFVEHTLTPLLPNATLPSTYLYREFRSEPILWWEPLALKSEVESWIQHSLGNPNCVDQLIGFIRVLSIEDQALVGLPWLAKLVLPKPEQIARRTFLLAEWLIEVRSSSVDTENTALGQQLVDALVVAGGSKLAPYSE